MSAKRGTNAIGVFGVDVPSQAIEYFNLRYIFSAPYISGDYKKTD